MAGSIVTTEDDGTRTVRAACIDIGSNTTRLLVAERDAHGTLLPVEQDREFTLLGGGRLRDGGLEGARIAAVARAVARQTEAARACAARRIAVVATAAVRDAPNRDELCEAVRAAAGLDVAVLGGAVEASLAFAGATGTLAPVPEGDVGVVDVGGGSTELVVGTCADGVRWSASTPLGSIALVEAQGLGDPPSAVELEALRVFVRERLGALGAPPVAAAWAVGGSATAVVRLLGGGSLDGEALARATTTLCAVPSEECARLHGLHPLRARSLPAGLVLLGEAAACFGAALRLAPGGLREGVVLRLLDGRPPDGDDASRASP
jgi:exopolyphosphatase/guanosine-5'-triphosphate,3'-diphosphate pyrophosphatase